MNPVDANLKNQAMNASLWRLLQSLCGQGANFVVQVVLARLLLPADFGLIAMIWVVIVITQTFVISGYGHALIQRQKATHTDECSIFYFNIGVSILGCAVLWLLAPLVARFYGQPLLIPLTRVVSLVLVIGAFGHIHLCLLAKQIDFKTQCRIDVMASVVSGVAGVTMALLGFGVWSLVAQHLSRVSMRVTLAWYYSKWRPALLFSFRSLRSMFAFGSNMLFSSLLESVYRNIYVAVIGKVFSPTDLGFYSRANRLQQLPSQTITSVVTSVAFPVFSRVQADRARLKNGLRACLGMLAFAVFPAMIGLAAVARPLVALLLTEKWLPCVPYLQSLCVVGAMYPFYVLHAKVLLATGRSRLYLSMHLVQKIIIILTIVVTYRWGIMGIIIGQIAGWIISSVLLAYISGRLVGFPLVLQLAAMVPAVVLSAIIAAVVHGIGLIPFQNQAQLLAAQVASGAAAFILFCWLFKPQVVLMLWKFIRERTETRRAVEVLQT